MDISFIFQLVTGLLIAMGGFILKGAFNSLTQHDKRINKLEVDMARNTAENESLFKRLDNIESKLDRLLEGRHGKI
jgi:tetrahydromethanopterin S-methyltransferase subunit G